MKGRLLEFDEQKRTELISGHDEKRYKFSLIEWKVPSLPNPGCKVDFTPNIDEAQEILSYTKASSFYSKKVATILFAFVLGAFESCHSALYSCARKRR